MIIDLLIIVSIIVFIIDYSGFIHELEDSIAKWMNVRKVIIPKPFSCSLCLSWWVGLIYIIVKGFTLLDLLYLVLLCVMIPMIGNVMFLLREVGIWITNKIQKLID